jgi:hypothetical protein
MSFQVDLVWEVNLNKKISTLITCQISPITICSLFSIINSGLTLTTVQPIDFADEIAKFKF